ncbi:LmbU family transcriptional regulator [Actinoplanes derwentensis]|nr:LmbU family transcriptional regulator [Actinoplanes derwentensis]
MAHVASPGATDESRRLGVQLYKSGLTFTSKPSLAAWEQVGANLFSFANSSSWWIADWLVYGESTFNGRYVEAAKRTSLSYQTLRNYTWVASRFPMSRRRHSLSFSHHLEVVSLERAEQDYWLRKAEELGWSRNKLRTELRASLMLRQGEQAQPDGPNPVEEGIAEPASAPDRRLLHLQLSADELAGFERAASKEREHVETWAAEVLRRAAAGS